MTTLNELGDDTTLKYYVEHFKGLYDRNNDEFSRDLDQLIGMAKMYGAAKEKYRLLELVRTKHIGLVVEAFKGDTEKMIHLAAKQLAKHLEAQL